MTYVVLSKIFWFFAAPSSLIVLMAVAGVTLMAVTRHRRGLGLLSASAVALGLLWLFPIGDLAIKPLESRFPQPKLPEVVDGIVLVSGVAIRQTVAWKQVQLMGGGHFTTAAALARRYPAARIVLAGDDPWIIQPGDGQAEFGRRFLESLGVSADRIMIETRARNKYENARAAYALARPEPGQAWVVIASAYQMPRVIGAYRRAGWTNLLAYPVNYESADLSPWPRFSLSIQLLRLDLAVREWLGLFVYWALDRSSDLYPGT